jgi:peptidyl-tRNA hydrolase, PTH1 family
MIKLFVGLGNPGLEYDATRHNAGFWWIDDLAQALNVSLVPDKTYFAKVARCTVDGHTRWLLQPHDELDIIPGQAKLKFGGGHAGHNGLRDIHAQLGSPNYWRLRLGVGHPGDPAQVIHWVLKKPSQEHRHAIEDAMLRAEKALPLLMTGDMDKAMLNIHTTKPPQNRYERIRSNAQRINIPVNRQSLSDAGTCATANRGLPETAGESGYRPRGRPAHIGVHQNDRRIRCICLDRSRRSLPPGKSPR